MNINNNLSSRPQFTALNVSKNTLKIMDGRGELEEFQKLLPELQRKAKKSNITVYAVQGYDRQPHVLYGMSIRPLNRLKDNPVTKFLGISNNRCGDAFLEVNDNRATESTFRAIYNSAYMDRRATRSTFGN